LAELPAPLAVRRLSRRRTLGLLAAAAGAAFFLVLYPLVAARLSAALGVRGAAALFLALALGSVLRRARGAGAELAPPGWARGGLAALLAIAAASGEPLWLFLIPAWIQLALAAISVRTLRHPPSLIERAGRFVQPYLPEFVAPYCRAVTALWAAIFGANALAIAALAIAAPLELWQAYTGLWMYAGMAGIAVVEYFVRKLWFRHYGDNWVDRLWARMLPQDGSARGRRTKAYVQEVRRRLASQERSAP
jgi:uncharacterized membrane protein